MPRMLRIACFALFVSTIWLSPACGGDDISDDERVLDDFLPELPPVTGESQSSFAGAITTENTDEKIAGPAASGIVGDYFIRNGKVRFVVQAPTRVVGVVPAGGNVVDASYLDSEGNDLSPDHFGEVSMMYQIGRDCLHDRMEVVRDGSDGGVAVLRARGVTHFNEFVNIRGIGLLPIQNDIVPDYPDGAECATTYVLDPDSATLEIHFTIYNPNEKVIRGPMGMINDTGGVVGVFLPGVGFSRLSGVSDALDATGDNALYMLWQGPEVAYGFLPRYEDPTTPNGSIALLGVSLFAFNVKGFLEILESDKNRFFSIEQYEGFTMELDVFVGRDAAEVETEFQRLIGGTTTDFNGTVSWDDGSAVAGARIALFEDVNDDGEVDEDDTIVTFVDTDASGSYSGSIPAGEFLMRAEVSEQARSAAVAVSTLGGPATTDFSLQRPVVYDYRIVDDGNGDAMIPGRITVIGEHPVEPDIRTHANFDRYPGIITTVLSAHGTSTDMGDGADHKLILPPGADYRIFVSLGTEWSIAELLVSPTAGDTPAELEFRLRRVIDSEDYVSSEYHVHSIGSPDSPVVNERRVLTAVADGIEFYATTDHDFVTMQQPVIEALGLQRLVRSIPGEEMSPLVYGHFNVWPMVHDPTSPTGGAVDWPDGGEDFAMLPREMFAAARASGAELVQVNHPRKSPGSAGDVNQHFDRMGLAFDYENRTYQGDVDRMPVPPDWLRLPPEDGDLFSDDFNALEVWNRFGILDTDGDGVMEITGLDTTMRDWFNFMSFGKPVTPVASSDTHYEVLELMGLPRTFVRVGVGMDSPDAIENGTALIREVLDNLGRADNTPTDVILSDGPMLHVTVNGDTAPLGKTHDGGAGSITVDVLVQSPMWAEIDTIELFANNTPEIGADPSSLQPFACYTTRTDLQETDPCGLAGKGGAATLTVTEVDVGNGFMRQEASISVVVAPGDIPAREGATGTDAWIVARVRGQRPIYPLFIGNLLDGQDVSTYVQGVPEAVDTALEGRKGRPATAVSSAFFVDFDGGGYSPQFAP